MAQNAVQIESVLSGRRKRKADDMDDSDTDQVPITRCFGIVTDAKEWMFLECTHVNGRAKFKLSRPYTVAYGKQSMKEDIKTVIEVITWLFTEAARPTTTAALDGRKRAKIDLPVSEVPKDVPGSD